MSVANTHQKKTKQKPNKKKPNKKQKQKQKTTKTNKQKTNKKQQEKQKTKYLKFKTEQQILTNFFYSPPPPPPNKQQQQTIRTKKTDRVMFWNCKHFETYLSLLIDSCGKTCIYCFQSWFKRSNDELEKWGISFFKCAFAGSQFVITKWTARLMFYSLNVQWYCCDFVTGDHCQCASGVLRQ